MTETPLSPAEDALPWSHPMRLAELPARKPTRFDITPDSKTRAAIAAWADIEGLEALRLRGELAPMGRNDWRLEAEFTARVVQACVITAEPVSTDLAEPVLRRYLADLPEPTGEEVEMPEDDTAEALPAVVDIAAVALEALELALPLYPRAAGAELGESVHSEPGIAPMTDEDTRPFAGLKALLGNKSDDTPEDPETGKGG